MKKPLLHFLVLPVLILALAACDNSPQEIIPPEPIGGLEPEALLYVEGRPWTPATIGMVLNENNSLGQIRLEANSSANKGWQRQFYVRIDDENMRIPANGRLNYWEVVFPILAHTEFKEYRDQRNRNSDRWQSHYNDWAGIRIDSTYVIEGVRYASGEFFANPGNDDLNPRIQEITGLFHHVRAFDTHTDLQEYFDRLTELELFED